MTRRDRHRALMRLLVYNPLLTEAEARRELGISADDPAGGTPTGAAPPAAGDGASETDPYWVFGNPGAQNCEPGRTFR